MGQELAPQTADYYARRALDYVAARNVPEDQRAPIVAAMVEAGSLSKNRNDLHIERHTAAALEFVQAVKVPQNQRAQIVAAMILTSVKLDLMK